MRILIVPGRVMRFWRGVEIWKADRDGYRNISRTWDWSPTPHFHYEVRELTYPRGSWWVPTSTHPPVTWWNSTHVVTSEPLGPVPLNISRRPARPAKTYIWVPEASIPSWHFLYGSSNQVLCNAPNISTQCASGSPS